MEAYVTTCRERSSAFVVALIAVLKAGCAYIPSTRRRRWRRAAILADSGAALLITEAGEAGEAVFSVLPLEAISGETATAGDVAYVIYTSGSTRVSKNVAVPDRNVLALVDACAPLFDLGPDDVWSLFHSMAFDFSVWEMWGALLTGATLVVVSDWTSRDPAQSARLAIDDKVTVMSQTPSAFYQFIVQSRDGAEDHDADSGISRRSPRKTQSPAVDHAGYRARDAKRHVGDRDRNKHSSRCSNEHSRSDLWPVDVCRRRCVCDLGARTFSARGQPDTPLMYAAHLLFSHLLTEAKVFILRLPAPASNSDSDRKISAHCESVGIPVAPGATAAINATPPGSAMRPLAIRSSSPAPPSVRVRITVLPFMTAPGKTYQWGVALDTVGPYFI
ncbi:MAG: hypothetical protein EOO32_01405 [Comamonadaceae bacterium]|nr:MAG: hypothetical protein EOO32_01405 [Comamonadaceae bacterium]